MLAAFRIAAVVATCAAAATLVSPARATFSVVAADTAAGAIGSARASCVPCEVIRILRVAKGHGLVIGQANFDDDALTEAKALLDDGEAPAAVLQAITDPAVFPNAPWMQYGIVDIERHTVSTTGPNAKPFADDLDGASGSVHCTVQEPAARGVAGALPELVGAAQPVTEVDEQAEARSQVNASGLCCWGHCSSSQPFIRWEVEEKLPR